MFNKLPSNSGTYRDGIVRIGAVVELADAPVTMELQPIAVRGDRLALSECRMISEDEFALQPGLFLTEVDGDGRFVCMASYDVETHHRAFADLEQRFLGGEGAAVSSSWSRVVAGHRAQNARDREAFGAVFTSDVVSVDHHYGGLIDRASRVAYVEAVASLTDPFPQTRSFPIEILAISDHTVVFICGVMERANTQDVLPFITLLHATPSGIDRIETFSTSERAAALVAYELLEHSDPSKAQ
jgi:hypothetical protein